MNFLASPPLVVAYALAGTTDIDLSTEPLGQDQEGKPVFLKDIWPSPQEVADTVRASIDSGMFRNSYGDVFAGDANWQAIKVPAGDLYAWEDASTYVRNPPYFDGMTMQPKPIKGISGARVLALLGDSVTTDHISPAGDIARGSPAAKYLEANGIGILFVVGGDGSMRGALAIAAEVAQRGLKIAVVGVPKTVDNDIPFIDRSFGFVSAYSAAVDVIRSAPNAPMLIMTMKAYEAT
jgi:aconitase A